MIGWRWRGSDGTEIDGKTNVFKAPELIELVMSRPLVSTGMVAKAIDVTPRATLRIVGELGLREMTGKWEVSGVGSGRVLGIGAWTTV